MPRLIDHNARDAEIAAASFRVLERDGLAGLSVRKVAEETGIAAASLRRAFPTQHALRERCLALIEQRVTTRIRELTTIGRERVDDMLAQLLPLNEDRRLELVAQVQLGILALTDPRLHATAVRLNEAITQVCAAAINQLAELGQLGHGRDPDYEIERLHALLDGLAMRGLWTGNTPSAGKLTRVLDQHLNELAEPLRPPPEAWRHWQ